MATTKYLLLFSLATAVLCLPTPITAASNQNVTAVFAFGDSILDAGNNNGLATIFRSDHPPYGHNFPGRRPSGRFSDGKLPGDFLVSMLGIKDLLPAYLNPAVTDRDLLTGASFASAGSGLDDLTAREANVLSLEGQLRYFQQALPRMRRVAGRAEADRVVKNAVFLIAAGTNDMLDNFYGLPLRRLFSLSGYQDLLLGNLENFVRRLYMLGARRVVIMGLPPVGCLPAQVTVGSLLPSLHMLQRVCVNQQNSDSQLYNAKLQTRLSRLQSTLPGSKIAYSDIYNPMMDMITRPAEFGLERTLEGCCGIGALEMGPLCNALAPICPNPSRYLFWDAVHPTQQTYMTLAKQFQQNVLPTLVAN